VVRKQEVMLFPCRRCGRMIRRQRECPSCDRVPDDGSLPVDPAKRPPVGVAPHSLELDEPDAPVARGDEDEDDSPYLVAGGMMPRCPKCHKDMARGTVLCLSCGFNLKTRKKAGRNYEPLARSWVTDMSLRTRLIWLAAAQGVHFTLMLMSIAGGFGWWHFVVAWPLLMSMLAFVLGTYDRIDLTRDARGRVKVITRWHFFFVPIKPQETDVRGFEGITTGQWHDAGFLEWFLFFDLLSLGLIPGIIWWYHAIYTPHYHVALARDHGHSEVYVYRGRSADQMNDVAATLCSATGLRNVS
jgi:hypothetical protein